MLDFNPWNQQKFCPVCLITASATILLRDSLIA